MWSVLELSLFSPESFWRDIEYAPFRVHLQPDTKENQPPNPIWKSGPHSMRPFLELRWTHHIFIPVFNISPWVCSVICRNVLARSCNLPCSVRVWVWAHEYHLIKSNTSGSLKKLVRTPGDSVHLHKDSWIQFEMTVVNVVLCFCEFSTKFAPSTGSSAKHSFSVWSSFFGNHNFFFFIECRWALSTWSTYALF